MSMLVRCKVCNYPIKSKEEVRCSICNEIAHVNCTEAQQLSPASVNSALALPRVCRNCYSRTPESPTGAVADTLANTLPVGLPVTSLNTSHFAAIMEQFNILGKAIDRCNANFEVLNAQTAVNSSDIAELKQENAALRSKIDELENQLKSTNIRVSVEEVTERIKRENNVVIFGLPPQNTTEQDISTVNTLLNNIVPDNSITLVKGFRVGKESTPTRPRPFKAILACREEAIKVLQHKRNVSRTQFPNVQIKHDLTPMQFKEISELRLELSRRQKDGETNLTIKYVRNVPKIVHADPKPTQKRGRDEENSPKPNRGIKINKSITHNNT